MTNTNLDENMENSKIKKQWHQPYLLVMPANSIQGGGPNIASREIRTGNDRISTLAHGGSGTVPSAIYDNAMS